jgi:hypothetical protein
MTNAHAETDLPTDTRECGFMGCGRAECAEACTPEPPTEATRGARIQAVMTPASVSAQIAEAFRTYAAERYEAALKNPDIPWLEQPGFLARQYRKVADDLRAQADRIEATADPEPSPHPVTEADVEVAARAMFEEPGAVDPASPDYMTWAEVTATDATRAEIWREDARRVLEAVEAARKAGGE